MARRKQATQKTPEGKEIPVPTRRAFFADLKQAARDAALRRTSTKK